MSGTVFCKKFQKELPAMTVPPMPGPKGKQHDGLILPESIAETYYHLSQQHRSAWSHEVDIRAFSDTAWWNS